MWCIYIFVFGKMLCPRVTPVLSFQFQICICVFAYLSICICIIAYVYLYLCIFCVSYFCICVIVFVYLYVCMMYSYLCIWRTAVPGINPGFNFPIVNLKTPEDTGASHFRKVGIIFALNANFK